MRTVAVIPVKPLGLALGRLSGVLSTEERRSLQWEMLGAVLSACTGARRCAGVIVVTDDVAVAGLAGAFGARVVADHRPLRGMNAAVIAGCAAALADDADAVLVLTADLPLVSAADIDAVIGEAPAGEGAVLVPSRDGTGTNLLLMRGPEALTPELGPHSGARHRAQAARIGLALTIHHSPAAALDIDTPEDLALLWARAPEWAQRTDLPPAAVAAR